jgi:hypothetical protein
MRWGRLGGGSLLGGVYLTWRFLAVKITPFMGLLINPSRSSLMEPRRTRGQLPSQSCEMEDRDGGGEGVVSGGNPHKMKEV